MMKQNRAISPRRNDQWSGKTFFSPLRAQLAAPRRSSTHFNIARRPSFGIHVPETRSDGLREVAGGNEEAGLVEIHWQLWKRSRSGTKDGRASGGHVEGGLVAGA